MRIGIFLLFLSACSHLHAETANNELTFSFEKKLAVAKMAGLCEAVFTMMEFKDERNIEGGEEFFFEFLTYTAERKGLAPKAFAAACGHIAKDYSKFLESARKQESN